MANHIDIAKRAASELTAARGALHSAAVLFTTISKNAALAGDSDESVLLAQIGAEMAATYSGERADGAADFFAEVNHG